MAVLGKQEEMLMQHLNEDNEEEDEQGNDDEENMLGLKRGAEADLAAISHFAASTCALPLSSSMRVMNFLLARLLQRYASTRMLLDNDEVNTVYSCSDFEATLDLHGKDTCPLWELSLLGEHFHPHVASSVAAVLSKTTSVSDIMKDPSSILNVNDVGEIFGEYKTREGHFNPAPPRKPFKKTLKKRNNAPEGDLESEAEEVTDHQAKVGLVTLFLRNN